MPANNGKSMMTLLKIGAAALIAYGLLNPSFAPKGDTAKCDCHAKA